MRPARRRVPAPRTSTFPSRERATWRGSRAKNDRASGRAETTLESRALVDGGPSFRILVTNSLQSGAEAKSSHFAGEGAQHEPGKKISSFGAGGSHAERLVAGGQHPQRHTHFGANHHQLEFRHRPCRGKLGWLAGQRRGGEWHYLRARRR